MGQNKNSLQPKTSRLGVSAVVPLRIAPVQVTRSPSVPHERCTFVGGVLGPWLRGLWLAPPVQGNTALGRESARRKDRAGQC